MVFNVFVHRLNGVANLFEGGGNGFVVRLVRVENDGDRLVGHGGNNLLHTLHKADVALESPEAGILRK